jgi:hypothetical protein
MTSKPLFVFVATPLFETNDRGPPITGEFDSGWEFTGVRAINNYVPII